MKNNLKTVLYFFTILIFIQLVYSQEIVVERRIISNITAGEPVTLEILVKNNMDSQANITVKEQVSEGFGEISPKPNLYENWEQLKVAFLEWDDIIPSKSKNMYYYNITRYSIEEFSIPPTKVIFKNNVYMSNPLTIKIKCDPNGICDTLAGENFQNCPEDCLTGIADNQCDFKLDTRCDPDCEKGYDPDCLKQKEFNLVYIITLLVIIFLLIIGILLYKRKKL